MTEGPPRVLVVTDPWKNLVVVYKTATIKGQKNIGPSYRCIPYDFPTQDGFNEAETCTNRDSRKIFLAASRSIMLVYLRVYVLKPLPCDTQDEQRWLSLRWQLRGGRLQVTWQAFCFHTWIFRSRNISYFRQFSLNADAICSNHRFRWVCGVFFSFCTYVFCPLIVADTHSSQFFCWVGHSQTLLWAVCHDATLQHCSYRKWHLLVDMSPDAGLTGHPLPHALTKQCCLTSWVRNWTPDLLFTGQTP